MILVDFECLKCGYIFEDIVPWDIFTSQCPRCNNKKAKRIISTGKVYNGNQDADWLKSVRDVVDKDGSRHCQEFLKNPTRDNYKRFLKGEGLRPLETGEPIKSDPVDMSKVHKGVWDNFRKDHSIEVRSG